MILTFTWTAEQDHSAPKGIRMVLRSPSFPKHSMSPLCADDRLAVCSWLKARTWEARFWVGYDSIKVQAGTLAKTMQLLEAELDKRSIGLFGCDAIRFVGEEAGAANAVEPFQDDAAEEPQSVAPEVVEPEQPRSYKLPPAFIVDCEESGCDVASTPKDISSLSLRSLPS